MVLKRVKRGIQKFWAIVDSEGVGIFQVIVYVHVIIGSMYGVLVAGSTPDAVEASMGHEFAIVWLWLCMGAAVCLFGKLIMRSHTQAGAYVQLIGDIFALGSFCSYVLATLETTWWGKAVWAVFIVAAIAECVALLVVRDIRRIIQIERILRR